MLGDKVGVKSPKNNRLFAPDCGNSRGFFLQLQSKRGRIESAFMLYMLAIALALSFSFMLRCSCSRWSPLSRTLAAVFSTYRTFPEGELAWLAYSCRILVKGVTHTGGRGFFVQGLQRSLRRQARFNVNSGFHARLQERSPKIPAELR